MNVSINNRERDQAKEIKQMRNPQKIENIHEDLQQIANDVAPDIVEYIRARVKLELEEYKLAPGYTDEIARDVIAQICYCAIKI